MARAAGCPFAPPPDVMALADERPLSRVRIWDGSTPWLITGHEVARELFADARVSVDANKSGWFTLRLTGDGLPLTGAAYELTVRYTGTQELAL